MENKPKKVAKPELQLVVSILVATSLVLAELYVKTITDTRKFMTI